MCIYVTANSLEPMWSCDEKKGMLHPSVAQKQLAMQIPHGYTPP